MYHLHNLRFVIPHNDLPSINSNNKPTKTDKQVNKGNQKRKEKTEEYFTLEKYSPYQ